MSGVTPSLAAAIPSDGILERKLGVVDGAALVIANVVGAGIFLTPGIVATMVPASLPFLGLWLLGGVLALLGALSYAELGARRPRAGGEYVYISEAFGPFAGFLSGWTSFVAGFSGAIAAAAIGFAEYLGRLVPFAASTQSGFALSLGFWTLSLSPRSLIALLVIALFTLVHASGLGAGRIVQNLLAALNVLTIVLLVAVGFSVGERASQSNVALESASPEGHWLVALVLVMFTYSGWNAPAYVAGEIRDPGRKLPRALGLGTGVVIALYLLLNILYLHALGAGGLVGEIAVGDAAARALFGPIGTVVFTPLVLLALASSVSAMVATGPRVYYAMACDGCLPRIFGAVAPRRKVPALAIAMQSLWSAILVLSGTFEALLTYTGFAIVLFSGAAVAALFVLRRRDRHVPRPYKVWGYPVAPAAFVLMSAAMLVQAIRHAPGPSLTGLLIIAAGAPIYFGMRLRRRFEQTR
jgi:APA family basic amino acid/polyamine antiporter